MRMPPSVPECLPQRPSESDSSLPHLRLLQLLGRTTSGATVDPTRNQRVFVNRTVRMEQIDVIGFDMDYTLALYHQQRMEQLSALHTVQKLIKNCGYSPRIAELPYDGQTAIRGLVFDKRLGNVLKMDRYGYVGRAYHGTRLLSRAERSRLYRDQKQRIYGDRFAFVDTLFAIPECVLFEQIVDFLDREEGLLTASADVRAERYTKLCQDIRLCIDEAHRDDSIKSVITQNLPDFVVKDPALAPTLHRLRSAGKRLFLLTNSGYAYTQAVMSYLLDGQIEHYPTWQRFFDVVVVDAKKPDFFTEQASLQRLDLHGNPCAEPTEPTDLTEPTDSSPIPAPCFYRGGSVGALSDRMKLRGDHVLYVGDHIYGDMLRAKRSSVWRTAMIIQELEDELHRHAQVAGPMADLASVDRTRSRLEHELVYQQLLRHRLDALPPNDPTLAGLLGDGFSAAACASLVTQARQALDEHMQALSDRQTALQDRLDVLEREIEHAFNPFWGPLFSAGTENSRFGQQVEDYACLYTSRVSNFLAYSPFQYFRSPRDHLPHERVYEPGTQKVPSPPR